MVSVDSETSSLSVRTQLFHIAYAKRSSSSFFEMYLFFLLIFWINVIVFGAILDVQTKKALCEAICATDSPKLKNCTCGTIGNAILRRGDRIPYDLVCKSDDILAIKLRGNLMDNSHYVVEKKTKYFDWEYDSYGIIDESQVISISGLKNRSLYKFRIFVVEKDKLIKPAETKWIKTLAKNVKPLPVKELKSTYHFTENSSYAVIEWIPADDLSCYYFLACVSIRDEIPVYIRNASTLFKHTISNIAYNEAYKITINAHNSGGLESESTEIDMIIPSCMSIHHNLSICVPDKPRDVEVEEELVSSNLSLYDLKISWSTPEYTPDWYEIWFTSLSEDVTAEVNASGDATTAIISNVKIEDLFHISIAAWSPVGPSEIASYTGRVSFPKHTSSTFIIISCSIGLFLLVCGCAIVSTLINYKIERRRKTHQRNIYFQDLDNKFPATRVYKYDLGDYITDEWEIDPKDLVLENIIGQGAFGVVRYGTLNKGKTQIEIAAKTLKGSPTNEELRHFQQELETMKAVGTHPHLVSLMGICLDVNSGPILVVEYCSKGDLQNYLKRIWEKLMCTSMHIIDIQEVDKDAQEFDNKLYDVETINAYHNQLITSRELLSYARQIAKGMEYLSKLKILHRDLAARNVLLCEDMTVKVSDFGLSRDVYKDNVYRKKAGGKLPIRWMAIECLTHQKYTVQSDVWSFGIVLWEIVTLGGNPYPGIATQDLLQFLKAGHRMECPVNIKQEIYDIMLNCWKTNPKERPTFTEIRTTLENLLESETEYLQLDLNMRAAINTALISSYKNIETQESMLDRYVKPMWR